MSDTGRHTLAASGATTSGYPPAAELATVSLALVVVGGVFMASYFPTRPPLALPIVLVAISSLLLGGAIVLLARWRGFAWAAFSLVARWALLAYVISAGMIEFSFVRNHASGAPLLVVSLMLVLFAVDVPLIIAVTVARYQSSRPA
jgi:hypothetical protein